MTVPRPERLDIREVANDAEGVVEDFGLVDLAHHDGVMNAEPGEDSRPASEAKESHLTE
jgi:hypothetical protein